MFRLSKIQGFSLIEVILCLFVLSLLVNVTYPIIKEKEKEKEKENSVGQLIFDNYFAPDESFEFTVTINCVTEFSCLPSEDMKPDGKNVKYEKVYIGNGVFKFTFFIYLNSKKVTLFSFLFAHKRVNATFSNFSYNSNIFSYSYSPRIYDNGTFESAKYTFEIRIKNRNLLPYLLITQ